MRDTVYCLTGNTDQDAIEAAVQAMVAEVQTYVPGYRLKQRVQFESVGRGIRLPFPELAADYAATRSN